MAGICAAFVVAGAAGEMVLLPRGVPMRALTLKPAATLKNSSKPGMMSQADLEALLAKVAKSLTPKLRTKLAEAVLTESARAGYDPLFILALVAVESSFRITVSSERGAYGLMQLKPSTFAWISAREPDIGADDAAVSEDPVTDVRLAVRYLRWLERRFHSRNDALMAYNAGPKRLRDYKRTAQIPRSLREYPKKVMREYRHLVRMAGGRGDSGEVLVARN
jgi:soluble lytic murein transglycosylase-like protein